SVPKIFPVAGMPTATAAGLCHNAPATTCNMTVGDTSCPAPNPGKIPAGQTCTTNANCQAYDAASTCVSGLCQCSSNAQCLGDVCQDGLCQPCDPTGCAADYNKCFVGGAAARQGGATVAITGGGTATLTSIGLASPSSLDAVSTEHGTNGS